MPHEEPRRERRSRNIWVIGYSAARKTPEATDVPMLRAAAAVKSRA